MNIVTVGNILLICGAIPATIAPLIYLRVPWFRTRLGRHLMLYMISLAVVFDLGVLRLIIGEPTDWFPWVRVAAFAFVVVVLWWRVAIVLSAQVSHDRELHTRYDDSIRQEPAQSDD